jgi:hypothetical protein
MTTRKLTRTPAAPAGTTQDADVSTVAQNGRSWIARLGRQAADRGNAIARACERHPYWLLAGCGVLYAVVIGLIALRKPFENDELFTLNIATLPSMGDVWKALMSGGEQLPPFFYVVTRASLSLFGSSGLALRLPEVVGFGAMCFSLFIFVSRRSSALQGVSAILFVLTTEAYYYAFEARPYGIVLGLCGLALVCWQSLADGRRRTLSLAGLSLCLAAAISCHYYAVLALLPFACGEATRTAARRRVDVAVWAALVASLTPLLLFMPLVASARTYAYTFWAHPHWSDLFAFYYAMTVPVALPLTGIVVVSVLYFAIAAEGDAGSTPVAVVPKVPNDGLRSHEVAAAVGFMAIPLMGLAVASLFTGAFTNRYALPAVIGLGILVPFGLFRLARRQGALAIAMVLCLALGFARRGTMTLEDSSERIQKRLGVIAMVQAGARPFDEPIVCSDQHLFLILSHYAPPDIRSRLVYLADPDASLRHLGHDSLEWGLLRLLRPWFGVNVQEYRPYLTGHRSFFLLGDPQYFLNWVLRDLTLSGALLELRADHREVLLFHVRSRLE